MQALLKDGGRITPLQAAASYPALDNYDAMLSARIVELLIRAGADPKETWQVGAGLSGIRQS